MPIRVYGGSLYHFVLSQVIDFESDGWAEFCHIPQLYIFLWGNEAIILSSRCRKRAHLRSRVVQIKFLEVKVVILPCSGRLFKPWRKEPAIRSGNNNFLTFSIEFHLGEFTFLNVQLQFLHLTIKPILTIFPIQFYFAFLVKDNETFGYFYDWEYGILITRDIESLNNVAFLNDVNACFGCHQAPAKREPFMKQDFCVKKLLWLLFLYDPCPIHWFHSPDEVFSTNTDLVGLLGADVGFIKIS